MSTGVPAWRRRRTEVAYQPSHQQLLINLWQSAFERAPGRSEIGMNLARTLCAEARYAEARDNVMHVLQFNPDLGPGKQLLRELNATPPRRGR